METIEFPPIDSAVAPAQRNEVSTAAAQSLDFARLDLTDLALAKFGDWRGAVSAARLKLDGLVLDLSTQAKVNEAKTLRQSLINAPRAEARATSKDLRSKLSKVGKDVSAAEDQIVGAWDATETLITPKIDAAQQVLDDAKAERERAAAEAARVEAERKQAHEDGIRLLADYPARARGKTAAEIAKGLANMRVIGIEADRWEEYTERAAATLADSIQQVEALHAAAVKSEADAAELEALRAEKAARDAEDALCVSIEMNAARVEGDTTGYIRKAITAFETGARAWENDPRPRVADAIRAGLVKLAKLLAAAETREAEEARQREAAEAETRLLQDSSRGLTDALASKPDAMLHAREAAAEITITREQDPQHVLKAEPATADATDRGNPAYASPVGGPMGAGQPAAAGPAEADTGPPETSEADAIEPGRVTFAEPEPADEVLALLKQAFELSAYAAAPFFGKFPSHPKTTPEWWAGLRERIEAVQPLLQAAISKREVA